MEDALNALLTEIQQAAGDGGGAGGDPQQQRWQLLGKNWERLLQVALVTMDRCVVSAAAGCGGGDALRV